MGPEAIKALISSVMEKQGLDIMGLASKLGVNADMIGGFLNGSSIPGADIIQKLMGMNAPLLIGHKKSSYLTCRAQGWELFLL